MSVLREFRRPRVWLALWGLLIAAVLALSLLPPRGLPSVSWVGNDKIGHALAYAVLSGYAVMLFARVRTQLRVALGLVVMGVALEVLQATLTNERAGDPLDAIANTTGVLLGLALARTRVALWLQRADARLA